MSTWFMFAESILSLLQPGIASEDKIDDKIILGGKLDITNQEKESLIQPTKLTTRSSKIERTKSSSREHMQRNNSSGESQIPLSEEDRESMLRYQISRNLSGNMRNRNGNMLPVYMDTSRNDDYQIVGSTDDADVAAGQKLPKAPISESYTLSSELSVISSSPGDSVCTINTVKGHPTDLEFFEDLIADPVLVLGLDISHLSKQAQFAVCACGMFCFSLLYGYLQELLSVELCSRQLGLFLAMVQFSGYTSLAYFVRNFSDKKMARLERQALLKRSSSNVSTLSLGEESLQQSGPMSGNSKTFDTPKAAVSLKLYLGLSLLRAVDLAMTNLAMQYINYPAKTLMKSSRVVFTMVFGVLIHRKVYKTADYLIVAAMVGGLALFMHADANSNAVFHYMGVTMLTISLICDGAISNMSETIMHKFGVGQDEFIFRMYSIALIAISAAAAVKGDLKEGLYWMTQPGTYAQFHGNAPMEERVWTVSSKIAVMLLFSSMGFFGSSCSAAITKNFGALTMSITSTARKATTLFLSFFLFNNVCTPEHVAGIALFISALTTKSLRRRNKDEKKKSKKSRRGGKATYDGGKATYDSQAPSSKNGGSIEIVGKPLRRTNSGSVKGLPKDSASKSTIVHVV